MKELMTKSKDADAKWKLAAKPHSPHPLELDTKECRKELRSATRRTNTAARDRQTEEIMNADANDKQLFYCLIRRQQASKPTISTLSIEDVKLYFEKLALPQKKPIV